MIQTFKTIGAVAWPSRSQNDTPIPGWGLVLDMCADENIPDDVQFRLRESYKSSDVLNLVGWARKQKTADWYSDYDKRAMNVMSYHHYDVPISPAPYIELPDCISLYLQILYQCLGAQKLLFIGDNPIGREVKEQLVDLRQDKAKNIQDYPAVAALSYVASAAYLWYKAPEKEYIPTHAEHIIASVEGKKDYESWSERFLYKENEVSGDEGLW